MGPISVTASVEQFLTAIHTRTGADLDTALRQSIDRWLSYYRSLQMVRGGGYTPSVVALMRAHFYTFAQAVLDDFTVTFCTFFALPWPRAEMTHARLTRNFADIYRENMLQGPIADVHAFMRDLYVRVVAHRLDNSAANMDDHLNDILTCINQYIAAMLWFCEQNIQHSIFRHHPRTTSAGSPG